MIQEHCRKAGFFRSITIVFQNNFPPAVHHIFWAERQPKRILAPIGARENIHHSKNYFKVKNIKTCNDFFIYLKTKNIDVCQTKRADLGWISWTLLDILTR